MGGRRKGRNERRIRSLIADCKVLLQRSNGDELIGVNIKKESHVLIIADLNVSEMPQSRFHSIRIYNINPSEANMTNFAV